MPIYFTYRSPFNALTSKFTKRIESDSILEWFQEIWRTDLDEEGLYDYYVKMFGTHFYGLRHFSNNLYENKTQKPESIIELKEVINSHFYVNELKVECEKYLEALTDDDELALAWYIIEEEYAKTDLKRFSYLIYDDWRLPLEFNQNYGLKLDFEFKSVISPNKKKEGEIYFISVCSDTGDGPIDYNPTKIEGIRLPDLGEYLAHNMFNLEDLNIELLFYGLKLKESVFHKHAPFYNQINEIGKFLTDLHKLFHYYIEFDCGNLVLGYDEVRKEFEKAFLRLGEKENKMRESKQNCFGKINEYKINGNEHFIQISIQGDFWGSHPVDPHIKNSKIFDQIFIFDDIWVNYNADLAYSLLNYCTKWKL